MADHPDPLDCSAPGCDFSTPPGAPDFAAALQLLTLHTQAKHSQPAAAAPTQGVRPQGPQATCKVDKRPRPIVRTDMSEHDWRYFLSEWKDYVQATGISGQSMLGELWSCMEDDLKRLAFDQGGKDGLTDEALMLARIKLLAVTILHTAVHTVKLHNARQSADEPTKAFAARVRGIAASCHLSKVCPCGCTTTVSFLEEVVYHVVMAGLRDQDMQERCMSAAILKTITDIHSLVEFCSAEENGRISTQGTVGGLRTSSTYKQDKKTRHQEPSLRADRSGTDGSCGNCGSTAHGAGAREKCRAWGVECFACHGIGHLKQFCRSKPKVEAANSRSPKPVQTSRRESRPRGRGSNSALEETEGALDAFDFCGMEVAEVPMSNRFDALALLGGAEVPAQQARASLRRRRRQQERMGGARRDHQHTSGPGGPAGGGANSKPFGVCAAPSCRAAPGEAVTPARATGAADAGPPQDWRDPVLPLRGHTVYPTPAASVGDRDLRMAAIRAAQGQRSRLKLPPLCHMEYEEGRDGAWAWREARPMASPQMPVSLALHGASYDSMKLPRPRLLPGSAVRPVVMAVADTGAQMDVLSATTAMSLGLDTASMMPVRARVFGASGGAQIEMLGGVFLEVRPPPPPAGCKEEQMAGTVRLFYVAKNVAKDYLSLATLMALGVVGKEFPSYPQAGRLSRGEIAAAQLEAPGAAVPRCRNSGVVLPGEEPCSCPVRELPPAGPVPLPCAATKENLPKMKQFLLDRFAPSTFNVCEHQPLPLLKGSPPLELHVDPTARPIAVHTPAVVPLSWKKPVKAGIDRDIRLGVLEKVPVNTAVRWQSRMVVTAKQNGEPRRVVDYQAVNECSPRQTHHTPSPWHLVSSIPGEVKKTTFDCWHGYHSLALATEADRAATTFITEWGRLRYRTCPQGFISAGDAYTDRMDRLFEDFERQVRCIDDTCLYDDTIEAAFTRACEFLERCGQNGVLLNPKKFQFAEDTVEYLGFMVTDTGVRPTESFIASIMNFPTPSSLTDVRSWFGCVAQVSYAFAASPVMEPFRHLLSSKVPFSWSPELGTAFLASKREVVRQCEDGVRSFDPKLPTALATDWSKMGMGYWLCQKRCQCSGEVKPGCCATGWQTVFVGSRFCTSAEQRYSPVCGEAAAAAWAVEKCRFFLLGMDNFLLCVDHRPLLKIFSPTMDLGEIVNPRLYNQKIRMLPYRFTPVYIPGKEHVVPDCHSRRGDSPVLPEPAGPEVDLLDIENVESGYSDCFGAPNWVSGPAAAGDAKWPHREAHAARHGGGGSGRHAHQHTSGPGGPADGGANFKPRGVCAAPPCRTAPGEAVASAGTADAADAEPPQAWLLASLLLSALKEHPLDAATEQDELEAEMAAVQLGSVRVLTWERLRQAMSESSLCQTLMELLSAGAPDGKKQWPEALHSYYPYRHRLIAKDDVILCDERPLIPVSLRQEVLEHLHAAHHGSTKMLDRARTAVFWPGITAEVAAHQASCRGCMLRAPSNPGPPPDDPVQPEFPFSHVVADFFTLPDGTYIAMADRYSNWLSVFKLKKDDSASIIEVMRRYFARWGVPKNFTSDGASVFTSQMMKGFFDRWGVEQRVASAYYPRANKRAEVAVKSAKRLVMDNLGPGGSLNTDNFARALMAHRNSPDGESGLSPAQILFGRQLRDHLPALVSRYQPRREWRLEADLREQMMARRHSKMEKWLQHGARALPPLDCGDTVMVQDQTTKDGKPGRWTKSGVVVEVLPHNSYMIKLLGSLRVTQRNRRFLRKLAPIPAAATSTPAPASTEAPCVTRAMAKAAEARAAEARAVEVVEATKAGPPLAAETSVRRQDPDSGAADKFMNPAELGAVPRGFSGGAVVPRWRPSEHRQRPAAPPGAGNIIDLLKQREAQGLHLAMEPGHN
jgi:hypothetical protein